MRRKKRLMTSNKKQYTKRAMSWILGIALIDMQLPYILALIGRENTLEDLTKTIVMEIVGVFLVYCVKSFFETREEKKNEVRDDGEIEE